MKIYRSARYIILIESDNNYIPKGFCLLIKGERGRYGITLGSMRESPVGMGKLLLEKALVELKKINAKKLWLMTAYTNWGMIACSIKCGLRIIRQDKYGYLFEYNFSRVGGERGNR